jgi:hypothetical protein
MSLHDDTELFHPLNGYTNDTHLHRWKTVANIAGDHQHTGSSATIIDSRRVDDENVSSVGSGSTFVHHLITALQHLDACERERERDYFDGYRRCEEVFINLYWLKVRREIIDVVDRQTLGPLINTNLPILKWYVEQAKECTILPDTARGACQIQSGLHFLLDDYGNFPISRDVGNGTLSTTLDRWQQSIDWALADFDQRFDEYRSFYKDMMWRLTDQSMIIEARWVPSHHTWWRMCTSPSS